MTPATDALLEEYRRLWQVFREAPDNRGPDVPPRQVCFDIERVEGELKAASVADPFSLVRDDAGAIEFINSANVEVRESALDDELEDLAPPAPEQPAQLSFF